MKIVVFIMGSLFKVGGYQVFTYNLLDHLNKNGHETYLVVPKYELNENRLKYENLPYEVLGVRWSRGKSVRYLPALARRGIRRIQDRLNADVWQVVGGSECASPEHSSYRTASQ